MIVSKPFARMPVRESLAALAIFGSVYAEPDVRTELDDSSSDADGDGKARPGERIDYDTAIRNDGDTAAEDVAMEQATPGGTTDVPDSVRTTPLARADAYASIGNVGIEIPAESGLLANDFDLGPTAPTVTAFDTASAEGGTVSVDADGGFIYQPPAGFEGEDSFTYTIQDENPAELPAPATGSNIATVTLTVSEMVWVIDGTAPAGGDGTVASPFNSLAQQNANDIDKAGDCVFIASGTSTYDGGLVLETGQTLVGQGATAPLATIHGITEPSGSLTPSTGGDRPVVANTGGDALALASNHTVRGLDLGDSQGVGLAGSAFGTLAVSEMAITTSGQAIALSDGTANAAFGAVTKNSSDSDGVVITDVAGSVAFGPLAVTSTGAGRGIELDGTGTGDTIFLLIPGATVSSAANTAVALSDGTFANADFANITSAGGTNPGIRASGVSGPITVRGGSITDKTDTDAVFLENLADTVTFNDYGISGIRSTGDTSAGHDDESGADAIHGVNLAGGLVADNLTIDDVSDCAINGEEVSPDNDFDNDATWNGLTVTNSSFTDCNRYYVSGNAGADGAVNLLREAIISIQGCTGEVLLKDSDFNRGHGLRFLSSDTGAMNLTVQGCNFDGTHRTFTSPQDGVQIVGAGLRIEYARQAGGEVIVGDPAGTDTALGNSFVDTGAGAAGAIDLRTRDLDVPWSGSVDFTFSMNRFECTDHYSDADPGSFLGFPSSRVAVTGQGSGVVEGVVRNNDFIEIQGVPGNVGTGCFDMSAQAGVRAEVIVRDNLIENAWNFIHRFSTEDGSDQFVHYVDNTITGSQTADAAGTDVEEAFGITTTPLPFETNLVQTLTGGEKHFTGENFTVPQHDVNFNGPGTTDQAIEFKGLFSGDVKFIELDAVATFDGFEFDERTGADHNYHLDGSGAGDLDSALAAHGNTKTTSGTDIGKEPSGTVDLIEQDPELPVPFNN